MRFRYEIFIQIIILDSHYFVYIILHNSHYFCNYIIKYNNLNNIIK